MICICKPKLANTFLQSVDFADYDPSEVKDVPVVQSPTSDLEKSPSSPAISSDPVDQQSPYLVSRPIVRSSPPTLKSIIKYPQQPVVQQEQLIEFELVQPPSRSELSCEIVFTSEPPQPKEETSVPIPAVEMTNENIQPPTIAVNNGTDQPDLFDPWCDPNRPRIVQFQDISAAAFKIKSGIMNTPCTRSHLSNLTGSTLFFKKDFLQYTGSFKVNFLFHNWLVRLI